MPYPLTSQEGLATNPMKTWEGNAPAVDLDGIVRNFIFSPRFITKTAAYTVQARETGTVFVTTGATAAVTFTLPAIAAAYPYVFTFISGADVAMTVATGTADTLVTYNDLTADSIAFSTSSEIIGGVVDIWCDGVSVFGVARMGDPRYQTATIATA
jgi:hypothetical protein